MQVLLRSVMNDTFWASTHAKHYLHERRSFVDLFNLHHGKKKNLCANKGPEPWNR